MVLDTTYYNKEHKELFDNFVGKPYTFFEAIKRRGVGSKRMIVDMVSPNLNPILNTVSDLNYANIEMRKNGILVHITKGHKNFTWAISSLKDLKIAGSAHAQPAHAIKNIPIPIPCSMSWLMKSVLMNAV